MGCLNRSVKSALNRKNEAVYTDDADSLPVNIQNGLEGTLDGSGHCVSAAGSSYAGRGDVEKLIPGTNGSRERRGRRYCLPERGDG